MMKRIWMLLLFFLACGTVALDSQDVQAAGKKVKAVVKGTTLTISGKGAVPSSLKVKNKKRIKKIVIKKGITSIPAGKFESYKNVNHAVVAASVRTIGEDAFHCKKLKKLTIPGDFKFKKKKKNHRGYWITGKVDTVTFNTKLKLDWASSFDATNLVVKKSDPKYKSIDGVIYSKDGKAVVRIPYRRKSVKLKAGCEVFCLQSVLYANTDEEGEPDGGGRLEKITVPSSVKSVDSEQYFALRQRNPEESGLKTPELIIKSRQLDAQSFLELIHTLQIPVDALAKQVPAQITEKNEMYVYEDKVVLSYKGKGGAVAVPDGMEEIGEYAFSDGGITKLILPDSVTVIGTEAFYNNPIRELALGKNLTEIGAYAFSGNVLKEITLPASVVKIGREAFFTGGNTALLITITGSSEGFADDAFSTTNILKYAGGSGEIKTSLHVQSVSYSDDKIEVSLNWTAVQDIDGYQAVISNDRNFGKITSTQNIAADKSEGVVVLERERQKGSSEVVYVRLRPYTVVNGVYEYGRWTNVVV